MLQFSPPLKIFTNALKRCLREWTIRLQSMPVGSSLLHHLSGSVFILISKATHMITKSLISWSVTTIALLPLWWTNIFTAEKDTLTFYIRLNRITENSYKLSIKSLKIKMPLHISMEISRVGIVSWSWNLTSKLIVIISLNWDSLNMYECWWISDGVKSYFRYQLACEQLQNIWILILLITAFFLLLHFILVGI